MSPVSLSVPAGPWCDSTAPMVMCDMIARPSPGCNTPAPQLTALFLLTAYWASPHSPLPLSVLPFVPVWALEPGLWTDLQTWQELVFFSTFSSVPFEDIGASLMACTFSQTALHPLSDPGHNSSLTHLFMSLSLSAEYHPEKPLSLGQLALTLGPEALARFYRRRFTSASTSGGW